MALRLKEAVPLRRLVPRTNGGKGVGVGGTVTGGAGRLIERQGKGPHPRPLQASPNRHTLLYCPPIAAYF